MNIPFVKHTLSNGLDVLLHQDRACPIVAVNVPRRVQERAARSHGVCAPLRALDVRGVAASRLRLLRAAARSWRLAQRIDQRRSDELLGGRAVECARAGLVDGIRPHGLPPARADRIEVREPAGRRSTSAVRTTRTGHTAWRRWRCWPRCFHPGIRITGRRSAKPTILRARLDDVRRFFATYYHPANASLALAGDIDLDGALALADTYFGELPAGPSVEPVRPQAPPLAWRRGSSSRTGSSCRLYLAWLTVPMFETGDADPDLAADILANGKTSRLYRRLVFEEQSPRTCLPPRTHVR